MNPSLNRTSTAQLAEIVQETKQLAHKDPVEALIELHINRNKNLPTSPNTSLVGLKVYPECLLQYIDIFRLRALVYRDTVRNDKNKQRPFVIVV